MTKEQIKQKVDHMDLLGMMRQAGFGRAAMHDLVKTVWKDGIDIEEPSYSIKAFTAMILEAAQSF